MIALAFSGGLRPPRMQIVGCEFFRSDGSCKLAGGNEPLRLWLDVPPGAGIAVFDGLRRVEAKSVPVQQGTQVVLDGLKDPTLLSVHIRSPWYRWRWHILRFTKRQESQWVSDAWESFESDNRHKAQVLLRDHVADSQTAEEQARTKTLSALIEIEDRHPEASKHLAEAIELNQKAGLISDALELGLWQQNLLIHESFELKRAEQELAKLRPLFEKLPQWGPWEPYHRAEIAYLRGDLRSALGPIAEGLEQAALTGNNRATSDLLRLQALIFVHLGRFSLARQQLQTAAKLPRGACRTFDLYKTLAWLELRAIETAAPVPAALTRAADQQVLKDLLTAALRRTANEGGCSKPLYAAQALTYLAQLAAQRGDDAGVRDHIQQAQSRVLPTSRSPAGSESDLAELRVAWRVLLADAERRSGQLDQAEKQYQQLATSEANFYDAGLWGHAGLAQVWQARGDADKALEHYDGAERYLDERSLAMPLGSGQGGYLARYGFTTSLYVDLLLQRAESGPPSERQGWLKRALAVIRHARTRGLLGLLGMERLGHLSPVEKQEYEAALDEYGQLRRKLDEVVLNQPLVATNEQPLWAQQKQQLEQKALLTLQNALAKLGISHSASRNEAAASLPAGQALLTCFPLRSEWACLLATAAEIRVSRFKELDNLATREDLSKILLEPFAEVLSSPELQKLRVVAYGPMREIDVHLLPFGPQRLPLWQRPLRVAYAADLPVVTAPRVASATPSAFLLFDTQGNLRNLGASAGPITESLQQMGYRVDRDVQLPVPDRGAWDKQRSAAALPVTALLDKIAAVDLFHLGSHFNYEFSGGLHSVIPIPDLVGLAVGDLLRLKSVPPYITLFGCNTARSNEEAGNLEVLGLTQTFLSKGAVWVVGTARQVDDALAARIAIAFFKNLRASAGDPHDALRAAVVQTGKSPVESHQELKSENDIGSYRVYEP